jgi:hypothetical protein
MRLNDRINYLHDLQTALVRCARNSADYDVLMKKARQVEREYDRLGKIRKIRDNFCLGVAACLTGFVGYVLAALTIICFG